MDNLPQIAKQRYWIWNCSARTGIAARSRCTFVVVHAPILSRKSPSPRLITEIGPGQPDPENGTGDGANAIVALVEREKATDYLKSHALWSAIANHGYCRREISPGPH